MNLSLATYLVFVGLTAGTILHLFLFVLLIAYRRPRHFEAWLSSLFLAVFVIQSGALLLWNLGFYYEQPPRGIASFSQLLIGVGAAAIPPLFVQVHLSYFRLTRATVPTWWRIVPLAFCIPWALFTPLGDRDLSRGFVRSLTVGATPGRGVTLGLWLCGAMLVGAIFQMRFAATAVSRAEKWLHKALTACFSLMLLYFAIIHVLPNWWATWEFFHNWLTPNYARYKGLRIWWELGGMSIVVSPILPSAIIGYHLLRHNFLNVGARRNLVYAVVGGFGAVLYLTLASRISQWLEPWFPPVATISILVFVLVFLYEPLQRALSRGLQRLMREEVEKVQRVLAAVHNEARGGELVRLLDSAEARIREEFTLEAARIVLRDGPARPAVASGNVQRFPMVRESVVSAGRRTRKREQEEIGVLEAYFHGGMLSGETHAALETLAAQLPAAIDLCRAIEEKLTLERELAERERLALLGQMAASISHNLKNPLGSMKTLLQVQLENPELPEAVRRDCQLVVGEVDRLAAKLNQLLRYAKPGLRESGVHALRADVSAVAAQVIELLRREAQQRGIALWLDRPPGEVPVRGSEEALSDVLQNLVVNAIEATPPRGAVRVMLARDGSRAQITVSDEGPGIPADICAKMFQPFFTTKPQGTGLGLAIVQRRLAEIGGAIECRSPAVGGHGTEFVVTLPLAAEGLTTGEHR